MNLKYLLIFQRVPVVLAQQHLNLLCNHNGPFVQPGLCVLWCDTTTLAFKPTLLCTQSHLITPFSQIWPPYTNQDYNVILFVTVILKLVHLLKNLL